MRPRRPSLSGNDRHLESALAEEGSPAAPPTVSPGRRLATPRRTSGGPADPAPPGHSPSDVGHELEASGNGPRDELPRTNRGPVPIGKPSLQPRDATGRRSRSGRARGASPWIETGTMPLDPESSAGPHPASRRGFGAPSPGLPIGRRRSGRGLFEVPPHDSADRSFADPARSPTPGDRRHGLRRTSAVRTLRHDGGGAESDDHLRTRSRPVPAAPCPRGPR